MSLTRVGDGLREAGLSEREIARKIPLFERASSALAARGADPSTHFHAWVPGRIEFLGKHTDYAGGRSLLCAIERGLCVAAAARTDRQFNVVDTATGDVARVAVESSLAAPAGHWSNYPLTVARRVASNFAVPLVGADVAFASDLPQAAGISSSSALVVAAFLVLERVNALASRPAYLRAIPTAAALAEYLGAVENGLAYGELAGERGVGTFGGSEDHTAILCAKEDALVQYSFCPVRHERTVPLPRDCAFIIASSGVTAEKSGAALERYNRLATLAHTGVDRLRGTTGVVSSSLAGTVRALGATAHDRRSLDRLLGDVTLGERVWQFAVENEELIPAAADALDAGNLALLGDVVDRSMHSATDHLHNQIDETVFLAHRARALGAIAASAFGAGFGGSVWALARRADADAMARALAADYATAFPARAAASELFVTRAAGGARLL
ncbi:MAG TPA: galactokinase family protein [Gemmatimonadaceae bacterium]|nr:galactokinase family protein [Gemmatimonadaceae bacterium]